MNDNLGLADMSDAEFRKALEQLGDWAARYRKEVGNFPVLSRITPGQVAKSLPDRAPDHPEPVERWIEDLEKIILPGISHWNHPGFLAYFAITGSGPGILADLISATLNVNGMLWQSCPALTELEQVVLKWYAKAMGMPGDWFGMIFDTASTSTLVALAAAREAAGLHVREEGLSGKAPLVLYCSEEAHSSVDKAGIVLGIGTRGVRRIPSDDSFRMRTDALDAAIREDKANGNAPFAVVATVGTTSATAIDPVEDIAEICRRHNLWLHVDAAYAGSAAVEPSLRWVLNGCQRADSLVSNPHKWLFTPIDCSTLFTSRPGDFLSAFSLVPEYLRTRVQDSVDLMNYSFQLGRRFRALKLWFVFRYFGIEGISARIREHVTIAREFAHWVDADPQFERLAPAPLSVVCFRVHPKGMDDEKELDNLNVSVLEEVNRSGQVFISQARLKGRFCLHLAVGNLQTTREDLRRAFDLVRSAAGIR